MGLSLKFVLLNPNKARQICSDSRVGVFTAETWTRVFNKYVPMDTGTLSQSYHTEPFKVIYSQPYSHYQWNGISRFSGNRLNYNKEMHPLAHSHWEEVAKKENGTRVAKEISKYIERL